MLNILYFFLLLLYASSITYPIPGIVIFGSSIVFFALLYRRAKIISKSKVTALVQLMCYSVPISWRNIFGGEYGSLPISWFYIIGALLAVYLLIIKREVVLKSSLAKVTVLIFLILIFSLVPLLITNPTFMSQGISQLLVLYFHHILILFAIIKGNILTNENVIQIEKSYIIAGLITSLGILTQFLFYNFGIVIGLVEYLNNRTLFNFLFADTSHATLYLATTAFLSTQLMSKTKDINKMKYTFMAVLILLGAAVTSARTGLIVFFVVYALYVVFGQKGIVKKVFSVIVGSAALVGAFYLLQLVRPQENLYATLFDSSGRVFGYEIALNMFYDKPFFGYGFGRDYIASLMHTSVPHLSFLQYLIHGGLFYTLMIFGLIIFTFLYAKKYKMNESWLILLTLIGTCLVPDIFSTRYITLLMVIVFLKMNIRSNKAQHS